MVYGHQGFRVMFLSPAVVFKLYANGNFSVFHWMFVKIFHRTARGKPQFLETSAYIWMTPWKKYNKGSRDWKKKSAAINLYDIHVQKLLYYDKCPLQWSQSNKLYKKKNWVYHQFECFFSFFSDPSASKLCTCLKWATHSAQWYSGFYMNKLTRLEIGYNNPRIHQHNVWHRRQRQTQYI